VVKKKKSKLSKKGAHNYGNKRGILGRMRPTIQGEQKKQQKKVKRLRLVPSLTTPTTKAQVAGRTRVTAEVQKGDE